MTSSAVVPSTWVLSFDVLVAHACRLLVVSSSADADCHLLLERGYDAHDLVLGQAGELLRDGLDGRFCPWSSPSLPDAV